MWGTTAFRFGTPVFFYIYISDLLKVVKSCKLTLFANDTSIIKYKIASRHDFQEN